MSLPPPITILTGELQDLERGSRLEWLEADGRGGYASGTATWTTTRRYHGLLVVARRPPTDRVVLLSRLEEALVTDDGQRIELGANYYPGSVHPRGHRHLEEFRLDPWPIWRYRIGPLSLTRSLVMLHRRSIVVLVYLLDGGHAQLELRPLVAGRDFHALVRANEEVAGEAAVERGRVTYQPYAGVPPLVLSHDRAEWQTTGEWYWQTVYPCETERGLDNREDLFCPGVLRVPLRAGKPWRLACSTRPAGMAQLTSWITAERRRRVDVAERGRLAAGDDAQFGELGARLALAGDAFIVEREAQRTVLAGYPWFADWGRDALISLPGLCLATRRLEEAAAVLRAFGGELRDGLVPNRFPDHGDPVPDDHYNAADAPLWFVEAVAALAEAGGDARELWPAVRAIIDAYRRGTRFGIRLEPDGLVRQGAAGVQLTWMDARVNGRVVTPRAGKAVEINALWYNALMRAAELARAFDDDAQVYEALAARARAAFEQFWYVEGGYLYDVIGDDGRPDASLRPNQLFAISLPHSALELGRARRVVDVVERELLVPLGVRTLAPSDPRYCGRYRGDQQVRDAAYHCGTAWPWLLGPFAAAYLRVHGASSAARERVRALLAPVEAHLSEHGLGHIAEIVDGDPPHAPAGCFAQAWSCAELLRVVHLLQ